MVLSTVLRPLTAARGRARCWPRRRSTVPPSGTPQTHHHGAGLAAARVSPQTHLRHRLPLPPPLLPPALAPASSLGSPHVTGCGFDRPSTTTQQGDTSHSLSEGVGLNCFTAIGSHVSWACTASKRSSRNRIVRQNYGMIPRLDITNSMTYHGRVALRRSPVAQGDDTILPLWAVHLRGTIVAFHSLWSSGKVCAARS